MKLRNTKGQFTTYDFKEKFKGRAYPASFLVLVASLLYIWPYQTQTLLNPFIEEVHAQEVVQAPKSEREQIIDYIKAVFDDEAEIALKVAKCESNLNPKAINTYNRNGSIDRGLFQINSIHKYPADKLFDWKFNIEVAKRIKNSSGWQAWACFNSRAYLNK